MPCKIGLLHECLECRHESNSGKWVGTVEFENDTEKDLIGIVDFDHESDTFILDRIIEASGFDTEKINGVTGEANCPACGSNLYYLKSE